MVSEEVSVVAVEEVAAEEAAVEEVAVEEVAVGTVELLDVVEGTAVTSPRFAANPSVGGSLSGALKMTKVDLRNTSP